MPGATPISHWIGFHLFVLVLLGLELVYARRQGPAKTHSTAVAATILWIAAALAFALFIFDAEKRRRFDAAFDPRIIEPPPETRSWLRRARDLDHALLRRWVTTY